MYYRKYMLLHTAMVQAISDLKNNPMVPFSFGLYLWSKVKGNSSEGEVIFLPPCCTVACVCNFDSIYSRMTTEEKIAKIKQCITGHPDFPKPGILFR